MKGTEIMVDWGTPKKVKDPVKCYTEKENWIWGECPLCGYTVDTTVDGEQCNWCGQYLIWPKLEGEI